MKNAMKRKVLPLQIQPESQLLRSLDSKKTSEEKRDEIVKILEERSFYTHELLKNFLDINKNKFFRLALYYHLNTRKVFYENKSNGTKIFTVREGCLDDIIDTTQEIADMWSNKVKGKKWRMMYEHLLSGKTSN